MEAGHGFSARDLDVGSEWQSYMVEMTLPEDTVGIWLIPVREKIILTGLLEEPTNTEEN